MDRLGRGRVVEDQGRPPTKTNGGGSTSSGAASGDEENEVVETIRRPLSRPMTECIRGVVLVSAVLPPIQDYVVSYRRGVGDGCLHVTQSSYASLYVL